MILMLLTGFGLMQRMMACNTIIQTIVPEEKRAYRQRALPMMAFVGMALFGQPARGRVGAQVRAPLTPLTACAASLYFIWFATRLKYIRTLIRAQLMPISGYCPPR